jgi:predicted ATPase
MVRESVFGRGAELDLADRFLEAVVRGASGAFVVEGEPGIGKTVLWREVVARAEGRGRVLRAAPAESEALLSYAALGDLASAVFDDAAEALPLVQQRALAVALGLSDRDAGTEARLIAAAVLSLLDVVSGAGALLVAIDDVQWLDRASVRALEFAARRTRGRLGWLLTRRGDGFESLPLGLEALPRDRVRRVLLPPLSVAALHHLLSNEGGRSCRVRCCCACTTRRPETRSSRLSSRVRSHR